MVLHLEEIMEDTNVYGWDKVQAFHAAWMNQMEQCRCKWADDQNHLKMRRALVLHATMNSKSSSTATSMGTGKKTGSTAMANNAPAKPGIETCKDFNSNRCFKGYRHSEWQHGCSFWLATTNRATHHPSQTPAPAPRKVKEKHPSSIVA